MKHLHQGGEDETPQAPAPSPSSAKDKLDFSLHMLSQGTAKNVAAITSGPFVQSPLVCLQDRLGSGRRRGEISLLRNAVGAL